MPACRQFFPVPVSHRTCGLSLRVSHGTDSQPLPRYASLAAPFQFRQMLLIVGLWGLLLALPTGSTSAQEGALKPVATINGFKDWVVSLQWSPDGQLLACGSYERALLWSPESKQVTQTLKGISGYASSLQFLANGKQLLIGSYQRIQLFDVATGKLLREFRGHRGQVTGLAVIPGNMILSASDDQTLRQWTLDGKVIDTWECDEPLTALAYSREHDLVALAVGDETRVTRPGELILFEREAWKPLQRLALHRAASTDVQFSVDGKHVLTTSFDETVIVTRIENPEPVGIFKEHARPINCLATIPGGTWLVTGSGGRFQKKNELILWQQTTGKVLFRGEPHPERIVAVAVSPDGKFLATGSHDKTAQVLELTLPKP